MHKLCNIYNKYKHNLQHHQLAKIHQIFCTSMDHQNHHDKHLDVVYRLIENQNLYRHRQLLCCYDNLCVGIELRVIGLAGDDLVSFLDDSLFPNLRKQQLFLEVIFMSHLSYNWTKPILIQNFKRIRPGSNSRFTACAWE